MFKFGGTNQIIKYLLFGTVILVPFVYLPLWSVIDFFYWPKYLSLVLITSILLIVLLLNMNRLKEWFHFDLINKLLLLYFILITISLFFSLDPALSIQGNFLRYDGYTTQVMYIVLFLFARTIHTIDKRFIYLVAISSGLLSIYGIIQYLGYEPFIRDLTRMNWTSAFSTFGNQNFFGSYLVLQLPIQMYIIIVLNKRWAYITYIISFIALLMTMTRSGWIGYCVSFLYLLIYIIIKNHRKSTRSKSIYFISVLNIIIFIWFNLFIDNQLLIRILSIINDSMTLVSTSYSLNPDKIDQLGSIRIFIWLRVIKLIKMKPFFGFGIENLHLAFYQFFSKDIVHTMGQYMSVDKAHNDYLHIAVSSGIPSLIVYLLFIISSLIDGIMKRNNTLNLFIFASVIGYLVCLFFNISVVSVAYILWIYLGLLCSYEKSN